MSRKSNTPDVNPISQMIQQMDNSKAAASSGGRAARKQGKLPDPKDPNARKRHFLTYGAGVPFPGDQIRSATSLMDLAPMAASPARQAMFAGTALGKLLAGTMDDLHPTTQDVVKVGEIYACGSIARKVVHDHITSSEQLTIIGTPTILGMNPGFAAMLHKELRKSGGLNGSDRKAFKSFRRSAKVLTKAFLKGVQQHG